MLYEKIFRVAQNLFCTLCLTFYVLAVILLTIISNTKKFSMVLKLSLPVLYGLLPCTILTDWFCGTETESVFCAVRTEFLNKTDIFLL